MQSGDRQGCGRAPADAGRIAALAGQLLSARTGLIKRLGAVPHRQDRWLARVVATMPRSGVVPGAGEVSTPGGTGTSFEAAIIPCLLEAVERYCLAYLNRNALYFGPARDAETFLYGERLPVFADWQYEQPSFSFRRLGPVASIGWVSGRSLVTGEQRFLPACLVHVPARPSCEAERIGISTSTGAACGFAREQAELSGLWEVCERDAFATMWLNHLSMPRLQLVDGCELLPELTAFQRDCGEHTLTFVDLTTDIGLPVVMAVLNRPLRGSPVITVGASCRPTLAEAARKALFEAAGQYERITEITLGPAEPFRPAAGFSNVTDFETHNLTYLDPALQPHLNFMTASTVERLVGREERDQRPTRDLLADAVARFAACGEEVISVDLTTPEIRDLGLSVVKVVVPGAVQLGAHHRFPPLGSRRIYRTPRVLGYRCDDGRAEDLYLDLPHPFA